MLRSSRRPFVGLSSAAAARLALVALALAALAAFAASCGPAVQRRPFAGGPLPAPAPVRINPDDVPGLTGFSSAVKVGSTIYVAGQVALDSLGRVVGPGDLARQTEQALDNLEHVVRAANGLPADFVKLTVYVVNYQPADYAPLKAAIARRMPDGEGPALTLVGVASLPVPGLLVAIDGTAALHSELPDRERDRRAGR
jgi:enamine deaminase RidA (YjgF/YER057c/UK114 family)